MSVEPPSSQPILPGLPPPVPSSDPTVPARSVRGYRILFYVATVVALVTTGLAWNLKKQLVDQQIAAYAPRAEKDYPFIVDAYGFKYQGHTGNVIDEHILRYGAFEKDHLFFIRDYLKNLGEPNAVVIDVGANTGQHSLFYSRHAARVIAFEPFPPVIAAFKQNLAINPHIKNIDLYEVGLGDANAELPFVAPVAGNHGQGSFRVDAPQDPGMKKLDQKLQIVIGDEYLKGKELGPVAFIKVDIEGFEESALKGLRQIMEKHRPLMEVEVSPPPMGTIDSFARFKALMPENYELYALGMSRDASAKGLYHLFKLEPRDFNKGQIELIACPKERLNALPGQ